MARLGLLVCIAGLVLGFMLGCSTDKKQEPQPAELKLTAPENLQPREPLPYEDLHQRITQLGESAQH